MRSLKKTVLIVVLSISGMLMSCNKKVDTTKHEQMPIEETTTEVVDSIETDTVAPVESKMDSISKK